MAKAMIVPIILCGGSGTRLWPASRENHPKQFLKLMNDHSLLQNTLRRTLRTSGAEASSLITVTLANMKDAVARQLSEIDPAAATHILCEPSARNTAAAVAFAADYARNTFGEDVILWILPADHHIADEDVLAQSFAHALAAAQNNKLVTFGINATRPDTGYGYIRVGDADDTGTVHAVRQFVEKPNLETAQSYLDSGDYLWNSGMFVFAAKTVLASFEQFAPTILAAVRKAAASSATHPAADLYAAIPSQPFDKAIMEKSPDVAVVPCNPQWSDIGSWESLWDLRAKDDNNNVLSGNAAAHNANGCLIESQGRLIAVAGLDNIVVVETADAILITNKSDNDSMKALVKNLKDAGAAEVINAPLSQASQPWTLVKTINPEKSFQTKELNLDQGQKIEEKSGSDHLCLFTVLEGVAVFASNGTTRILHAFESVNVDGLDKFTISNGDAAPLKLLQVQKSDADGLFFGQAAPGNAKKFA